MLAVNPLENFRAQGCYVPAASALSQARYGPPNDLDRLTRRFAEQMREVLPIWKAGMQRPKPPA